MSRGDGMEANEVVEPPPFRALAALAALYHQVEHVSRNLDALAASLAMCACREGLLAFRRVCVALVVTDELVELVVDEHGGTREVARRLREDMVVDAMPWLIAARRMLPGAAEVLRAIVRAGLP